MGGLLFLWGCTFLVVVFGATDIKSVDQNI
jgi:hypothetical protein